MDRGLGVEESIEISPRFYYLGKSFFLSSTMKWKNRGFVK